MKDPYSGILEHMRVQGMKNNPSSIQIGVVISGDPLTIKVGDLQINKDDILVADYLLKDYKMDFSMALTDGTGVMSSENIGDHGSHTHSISKLGITKGTIDLTVGLIKDDVVVMLSTEDNQTYIVLSRVVSL